MGGVSDFIAKVGFPAALVLVLIYGVWKLMERADKKQDQRDASDVEREKDRRLEREADRAAHVNALAQNTAVLGNLGTVIQRVEAKVDGIASRVEDNALRIVKGG